MKTSPELVGSVILIAKCSRPTFNLPYVGGYEIVEITEVRVKLMEEPGERLLAFCSITFDNSFVIRDLKIIEGTNGPFVAMPSRKLTTRCPRCRCKNHIKAAFCNQCGLKLDESNHPELRDESGRTKLYADIAHPINTTCREMIQQRVVHAYDEELERSKLPGYVPSYSDFNDSGDEGADYALPGGPHFRLSEKINDNMSAKTDARRENGPQNVDKKFVDLKKDDEFGVGIF